MFRGENFNRWTMPAFLTVFGWMAWVGLAQSTGTLSGFVTDAEGAAIEGAEVLLTEPQTGFERRVATDTAGRFRITNIPLNSYFLLIQKDGFQVAQHAVALISNIPQEISVQLQIGEISERVTVEAFSRNRLIDPSDTGTRLELSEGRIERMPVKVGNRGLEAVLMTFPGFAANANGAIHPRGAHNQMTFVIDGMPISDQLTGAFATALDPGMVQTLELFTGNIPPEYGSKVSGVANITTKSGLGGGRLFRASTELGLARFDTASNVTQFSGGTDRFGYFGSINLYKSNRFLDQVSLDNLHNGGNASRAFGRVDYQFSSGDQLRFSLLAGRSSFQLANLRSQHAAGQDQRQLLRDVAVSIGWMHPMGSRATFDSTVSYRGTIAQLFPSLGDTPVTAAQGRHLSTVSLANRLNLDRGAHTFRLGFDVQHFPLSENFDFAITQPAFNEPASEAFNPNLLRYDLTRGGTHFHFSDRASGTLWTGFFQDSLRWSGFMLSLGLRYDAYRFLVHGSQLQPRVGLAYHIPPSGTVIRASYNRNFQTPPNENLLMAGSEASAQLAPPSVVRELGGAVARIHPERQNVYEVGVQQSAGPYLGFNVVYYHKDSQDLQDNDNFFNTGIIFPTTLFKSRVNGVEGRINLLPVKNLTGNLSLTHSRTIVTPPFTGGLFLGSAAIDALSTGPFLIDHDQAFSLHGIAIYSFSRHSWLSSSIRYDSGLVSNPSDPAVVRADPDFFDLLPYVDLASDPPRVRPRTIVDLAFGHSIERDDEPLLDLQFQVSNLFDQTGLYNFQSIFVGTRLVQPRSLEVKLRWHW